MRSFLRRVYRGLTSRLRRAVAARTPLWIYQRAHDGAVGLAYHIVSSEPVAAVCHLYPWKTPEMFERDLIFLKQSCRVISYAQLESGSLRGTSVLVTFDDGYRECVSVARPLLLKHGIPCIFFVTADFIDNRALFYRNKVSLCIEAVTRLPGAAFAEAAPSIAASCGRTFSFSADFIDWLKGLKRSDEILLDRICDVLAVDWRRYLEQTRPFMTADEIRQLAIDGFTIGAHSCSHPRFAELSAQEIEREIAVSCRRVQVITGQTKVPFAFPFSADGVPLGLVASLKDRLPVLGQVFDCRGIRGLQPLLLDRVWADPPPRHETNRSNVGSLLRQAHEEYVLRALQRNE